MEGNLVLVHVHAFSHFKEFYSTNTRKAEQCIACAHNTPVIPSNQNARSTGSEDMI